MSFNQFPIVNNPSFSGIIGVAQKDITPPRGIYSRNWGAAKHDVAIGVHIPLMLSCITIQSTENSEPLILIGADLGWWKSKKDEQSVRYPLAQALGISPDSIMFCLSHTHSGPYVWTENRDKDGGKLIAGYLNSLTVAAIAASKEALENAAPATLDWKYGTCDLASNRDLKDEVNGRYLVGYNPGAKADNTLLVGRITNKNETIVGTLVNYACHPTSLGHENNLISPDFVGTMRKVIETATSYAPCLFLQGASGELAPAEQYSSDTSVADKYGKQLGYASLSTMVSMFPPGKQLYFQGIVESGAPLAIWKKRPSKINGDIQLCRIDIKLPLKEFPSLSEIKHAIDATEDRIVKEKLFRLQGIRELYGNDREVSLPVWIWKLGNSILVGQPYEAYSKFQLSLRKAFPQYAVAVINIVNGPGGYLPEEHLYEDNIYSTQQSPFKKGALEVLINATIERINQLLEPVSADSISMLETTS